MSKEKENAPRIDVDIDVDGRESATIVRSTAKERKTVST